MSSLANCPICGQLFLKNPLNMCNDCHQAELKNEEIVTTYVRDHPNTSLYQIHQSTGVKESTILRLIKSGRLIGIGDVTYACESCGAQITKGRLCQQCSQNLLSEIQHHNQQSAQPKQGVGMYTNYYQKK